jgi:hypothetical protein
MNWAEAVAEAARINCRHAMPAALKVTSDRVPPPTIPAMVLCKEKARLGIQARCNWRTCKRKGARG